jgi:hypothetical protein
MEPVTVWIMVAIYVGKPGISAELSPGMYTSEASCKADMKTVRDFMDQQGVIDAYGLTCASVVVTESPKGMPKGKGVVHKL